MDAHPRLTKMARDHPLYVISLFTYIYTDLGRHGVLSPGPCLLPTRAYPMVPTRGARLIQNHESAGVEIPHPDQLKESQMTENPLDKLLAQESPVADHSDIVAEGPQLYDHPGDAELFRDAPHHWFIDEATNDLHEVTGTQVGATDADEMTMAHPLGLLTPGHVVSIETLDDEVEVGDPRWEWPGAK